MRVRDSRSVDRFCRRVLVVTKSEADVRSIESEFLGSTNTIVHQGTADIFHNAVKPLCILGAFEEIREILLSCYRTHILANLFQFPGNLDASDSALDLVVCVDSPLNFLSPCLLVDIARRDRCRERFRKHSDSGCQRFYGLFIHICSLERP